MRDHPAMREVVERLSAISGRAPGTDAERRAARWVQDRLRERGREAELEPVWVRPQWALVHALHAALGVAASLVSTFAPAVGLGIAVFALVSLLIDVMALVPTPLRFLTPVRATQNVVSPVPDQEAEASSNGDGGSRRPQTPPVTLVLVAGYDAGRSGWVYRPRVRGAFAWLRRRIGRITPGVFGWMALALLVIAGACGARLGGIEETWLSAVQFVPTAGLAVAVVLLLDIQLSDPTPGANDPLSGAAVALELAQELDEDPPRNLGVELALCGATHGQMLGMRRWVRARRSRPRSGTVVLDIAPCGAGHPRWWTSTGPVLPTRTHQRMQRLAAQVSAEHPELEAAPHAGRTLSGSFPVLSARFPAITVGGLDDRGLVPRAGRHDDTAAAVDDAALEATLAFCRQLVRALDDSLEGVEPPASGRKRRRIRRRRTLTEVGGP
jgi:hypothetical protein